MVEIEYEPEMLSNFELYKQMNQGQFSNIISKLYIKDNPHDSINNVLLDELNGENYL